MRRGGASPAEPEISGVASEYASRLQVTHITHTISPTNETAARWGLVSAVPKAATRKLLGTRKISVTLTRSGTTMPSHFVRDQGDIPRCRQVQDPSSRI